MSVGGLLFPLLHCFIHLAFDEIRNVLNTFLLALCYQLRSSLWQHKIYTLRKKIDKKYTPIKGEKWI